jgi:DNA-binding GntR family transcriptional regulator
VRKTAARHKASEPSAESLGSVAHREIEQIILSGELQGGARLNELALSARLGISRGPIREAFRTLERSGLICSIANHGVFVRQIGVDEVAQIYDVRALLFGFACGRLARLITRDGIETLRASIAKMDGAIERGERADYYAFNLAFHNAVMTLAAHARAKATYDALIKELHLTRQRSLGATDRMRESNLEHIAIVAAIVAGDAERARSLAEAHAQSGKRRWLDALSE